MPGKTQRYDNFKQIPALSNHDVCDVISITSLIYCNYIKSDFRSAMKKPLHLMNEFLNESNFLPALVVLSLFVT